MLARLLADQGINTPAAIQPHVDSGRLEPREDVDDVGRRHRHRRKGMASTRTPPSLIYGLADQFQVCQAVPVAGSMVLPSLFHMLVSHTTPAEAPVGAAGSGVAAA